MKVLAEQKSSERSVDRLHFSELFPIDEDPLTFSDSPNLPSPASGPVLDMILPTGPSPSPLLP